LDDLDMRRTTASISLLLALACNREGEAQGGAQAAARTEGPPANAAGRSANPAAAAPVADTPVEPPPDPSLGTTPEDDAPEGPEPVAPDVPVAPDDYGIIKPPIPPPTEAELTLHGLAEYEVVAIHAKPDGTSPRLGYMRVGTRTKVGAKVEGPECVKGWHALPLGGFACASKGLTVAKAEPYLKAPPPGAALDRPLPYEYAYVRKWNTPMFWRVPTVEESAAAEEQRALLEAQREALTGEGDATLAATKPAKADAGDAPADPPAPKPAAAKPQPAKADDEPGKPKAAEPLFDPSDPLAMLPKPEDAEPKAPKAAKPTPAADDDGGDDGEGGDDDKDEPAPTPAKAEPKPAPAPVEPAEPAPPVKLPLNPSTPWLEKGFFVSLAGKVTEEGRSFWRTARGGFVPAGAAYKYSPKDFQGAELEAEADFPFGFAMSEATKLYELADNGKIKVVGTVPRRTFIDLSEETEIGGKAYMMTSDGKLVRKSDMRIAERQPMPEGLQEWERWIDVSLDQQLLVAYEGQRPVFTTLVSTGRKGSEEEPFETPTGRWRIRSKHVSTTMDGNTASDGNYSIQDVPWAMYFHDSFALHGAFWHDGFGRVRSHGCVNLGPTDARWLFQWTTPFLPEGWHGVHAHEGSPGTTVTIRR
jgi:lipoprotein-anchoring transpeptidase ErfK/SrfK